MSDRREQTAGWLRRHTAQSRVAIRAAVAAISRERRRPETGTAGQPSLFDE